ncbi:MAG TPA: glycosyltransferase family 1 protein [Patescibacteria group bacterium]|nr:glycosyltransferase family 1 protein [Patescibacteria group bacterium]
MRIGIDCRTILNPDKGEEAGVGHYSYQLVRHLLSLNKKDTFVLFFDRSVEDRRLEKFNQDNIEIKFFPFVKYERFMPERYRHFLIAATINSKHLDVFFSPIPRVPQSYNGKSLVTVHDLSMLRFPDLFSKKELLKLKTQIPDSLKQAEKIIAVSRFTANEIKKHFNIPLKKIKVIHNGIDKRFFNKVSESSIKAFKKDYGIKGDYILFLGTIDPRKNIARLIDGYEYLRKNIFKDKNYKLVLAGAKGAEVAQIERKIKFSDYKKDIILPGYIPAKDLGALFKGASLFVFPSLYEGFGIPPLEAMAKGVPTVASNIAPVKEVVGKEILKFNPKNSTDIAKKMAEVLKNKEKQKQTIEKGIEIAKEFSWEKCAKSTLKVLQDIAN